MMTKAAMLAVQEERRTMNVQGSLRQIAEESTSNGDVEEEHGSSPDEASSSIHEANQPGAVTETVIRREVHIKQYLAVVCPRCDCTFRDNYALKIHLNGKRRCDAGKFRCNKCHKRFSQASNRSRHQAKCPGLSQPRTDSVEQLQERN